MVCSSYFSFVLPIYNELNLLSKLFHLTRP
jgi:hypothetical protein